jgi:LmbE family N-acetylglucosaminyl deacetylase
MQWTFYGFPSENVHFLEFPELRFDELAVIDFNRAFVDLELESDLLITTDRTDVNQDHHVVFQSALVIARSIERQIGLLTAEIVSSSEWSDQTFTPHLYVDVEQTIDTKIDAMREIPEELCDWPHPRSEKVSE